MKYCPECRDEFLDSVRICPDDKVLLVDHLEPLVYEGDLPKKVLYEFTDQKLAEMVQSVLEENDIIVFLKNDMFGSAFAVHGASTVGTHIKMLVAEDRYEKALDLTRGMVESGDENDS
ncbi:MAG: DUF2007 domain-containing protein [Candidatus Marinimicrobia bacterium]|nr:DUF2007 domain-containing protein [Candidatus Neomarinimicrobiota bacterium]